MTSLLLQTRLDREQRDYVQTINKSGATLLRIIEDILDYSRVRAPCRVVRCVCRVCRV
jgi:signal transduction histidine kinase